MSYRAFASRASRAARTLAYASVTTRAYAPRIAFEDFSVGANVIINAPSTNTRVVVTASEVMEVVEVEVRARSCANDSACAWRERSE